MASTSADPLVYEAPAWLKELDGGKSGINREDIKVRTLSETYVVVEGDAGVADIFPELEAPGPATDGDELDDDAGGLWSAIMAPNAPDAAAPAPAQEVVYADGGAGSWQWYVVIGKAGATIRRGANLNTPLVDELRRGTKVAVLDTPKSYAEDTTKGSVRCYLRKPLQGWCSLKLLAECDAPKDAADARALVAIADVTDASVDTAARQRAQEAQALERAKKLKADFLSVRAAPSPDGAVVGTVRRARGKVTVVEFAPAGLHVGDSNEALDARAANWARISAPCEGWVPLAALEADNVCARRYRLNDPEKMKKPPNIVPDQLNGDGTCRRNPIRCACLHDAGTHAEAFSARDMGGIAAYMRRHHQMTLVFAEGDVRVFDGQYVLRGDRYVVDEDALDGLEPPPRDGVAPNCVGQAWLAHRLITDADDDDEAVISRPAPDAAGPAGPDDVDDDATEGAPDATERAAAGGDGAAVGAAGDGAAAAGAAAGAPAPPTKLRYEYRGVAEGLCTLIHFLSTDGVKWRERALNGCRFCVAHGQAADLMTIFWAMCGSGHMHDALKGCGDEGSGFPRSMRDRSHYVMPYSVWFMPIAACLVGGSEFGWADQLDAMGQAIAIELRRLLKKAPPEASPADLGYKLKYGADRHGKVQTLFSRSRLEFPSLHVIGKHDVHRASAERLYCAYSDGSRRVMYYDGKTEMPEEEFYGAEVCRFVARAMMEDAGTTYDHGPPSY